MAFDLCLKSDACRYKDGHAGVCSDMLNADGSLIRDSVNHPSHYGGDSTYEHIKVVEAWGLNYALGNATKYIARAGKKTANPIEDLKKAEWYIRHEIERLEKSR